MNKKNILKIVVTIIIIVIVLLILFFKIKSNNTEENSNDLEKMTAETLIFNPTSVSKDLRINSLIKYNLKHMGYKKENKKLVKSGNELLFEVNIRENTILITLDDEFIDTKDVYQVLFRGNAQVDFYIDNREYKENELTKNQIDNFEIIKQLLYSSQTNASIYINTQYFLGNRDKPVYDYSYNIDSENAIKYSIIEPKILKKNMKFDESSSTDLKEFMENNHYLSIDYEVKRDDSGNYDEYIIGKDVSCTKYGSGGVLESKRKIIEGKTRDYRPCRNNKLKDFNNLYN